MEPVNMGSMEIDWDPSPHSSVFPLFYLMSSSFTITENGLHWPLKIMVVNQQNLSDFNLSLNSPI